MTESALLVIDLQNDYFEGGKFPLWQAAQTEDRILLAMAKAQARGTRIILVQHVAASPAGPFFVAETDGVQLRQKVREAAPDAPVVIKHFADSFHETDLKQHLDGVSHLLVAGMMTQNCVTHTAISPEAQGYKVDVLADLCTTVSEPLHLIALNALTSRFRPIPSSDVLG